MSAVSKPTSIEPNEDKDSSGLHTAKNFRTFSYYFALPEWKWYLLGLIALAITNYISLKIPQFAKVIVDGFSKVPLDQLEGVALLIIALGFLQIIIRTLSRVLVFWPGRKLETSSKSYLFSRLMVLPQYFLDRFGIGDLVSRISNDITHIRIFYGFGALQIINLLFLMAFTIAQMLSTHWQLTLLALLPLSLMFVIMSFAMPRMHRLSTENQEILGTLTNRATEAFVNVHVIKVNAAEACFSERIQKENLRSYESNLKLTFIRQFVFPMMGFLAGLSQFVVLLYGGLEAIAGRISVGDIMAFNVYIMYLAFPLSSIGIIVSVYQRAVTALARISKIEEVKPEQEPPASSLIDGRIELLRRRLTPLSTLSASLIEKKAKLIPRLEVRRLNFAFASDNDKEVQAGTEPWSLQDISFDLAPGTKLGLVGAVGSGKSILLHLIARIYQPPPGTIFLDDNDVCQLPAALLRKEVALVQQRAQLFSDSVLNNICFGHPPDSIDQAAIDKVCRDVQIYDEIMRFEKNWQTPVGERGVRLSGGQKQRIALARALVRNASIILLDDVISAVDQITEQRLIECFENLKKSFIIASHRSNILSICDEVLLLDHGRIKDRGTLGELVSRHPDIAAMVSESQ